MNFLAHLLLAEPTPYARIGSLLPDLVRHRRCAALDPRIAAAVDQHHRVDAFTDSHAMVARSVNLLRPRHGRYSAILVDVLYDHLLAADFQRHAIQPLPDFVASVYRDLGAHQAVMPEPMRHPIAAMIEHDWLSAYATAEGIAVILSQMSRRLSERFERTVRLETAMEDLRQHREELNDHFQAFFPLLRAHTSVIAQTPRPDSADFAVCVSASPHSTD